VTGPGTVVKYVLLMKIDAKFVLDALVMPSWVHEGSTLDAQFTN